MLSRLLNSSHPDDLKAANKLIKEMVQEVLLLKITHMFTFRAEDSSRSVFFKLRLRAGMRKWVGCFSEALCVTEWFSRNSQKKPFYYSNFFTAILQISLFCISFPNQNTLLILGCFVTVVSF